MTKRNLFLVLGLLLLGGVWYLFRPELLFVKTKVDEGFPAMKEASSHETAMAILTGDFHSVAHETTGNAAIHELEGGKRVLRLTHFMTSNGPDVRVYLVAAPDASDSDTVKNAGYVELGKLKGTEGDQNYDVPEGLDLNEYRAVTIWCARFGVNFATAPLASTAMKRLATLSTGSFHGVAHETAGVATLYRLPDGKRFLRLTDFMTSNGPDVQVYLGKAPDATDSDSVTQAGFYPVGALKGTSGDQNYELPDDLDLDQYRSVTIWCRRFGVNFATAPLSRSET
jgi:Electron transfer DM13